MGGPSYLRALRAPLPQVKSVPTGGVDLNTAPEFIAAGASADSDILKLQQEVIVLKHQLELERQRSLERERRDQSERRASEEVLRRVNRQLQMISDCNQALIRASDEIELLSTVCKIAIEIGGYRMAWVGFAENDELKTVRPVAYAGFEDGYVQGIRVTWSDTETGRGPLGMAIRTLQPCPFQNIADNPQFIPWRPEALRRGYASVCGLPLIANTQVLGAFGIHSDSSCAFDADEVSLLAELACDWRLVSSY